MRQLYNKYNAATRNPRALYFKLLNNMTTKNPAAVALGKKRWKGTNNKKARSEHMRQLANKRHAQRRLDKEAE